MEDYIRNPEDVFEEISKLKFKDVHSFQNIETNKIFYSMTEETWKYLDKKYHITEMEMRE